MGEKETGGKETMKKWKMRAFVVNPYEITTDTGKVLVVDDEVVVGNVKDDGSFSGAVFDAGRFGGEVYWSPDEAKSYLGRELSLEEAENGK
jgi:hypothetical protein